MELTVSVCVRDGAEYVDRCVAALMAETAPFGTPIVVVDHDSRDATPTRLARWVGEYPDRLRVLQFSGDGLGAVRDFAWRQSATPWVGFVDIDCEVQPGWAQALYDAIRIHTESRCGGFGGSNRVPDGDLLYRAYSIFLATYVGGHSSILNRPIRERRQVSHCPTLNVVYRRGALEAAGGFDATYTRYCEDEEMSRRLVRHGYTLWADPGMTVEHALPRKLSRWIDKMFHYGRGRGFYLKRNLRELHPKFLAPPAAVLAYGVAALWVGGPLGVVERVAAVAVAHLSSLAVLLAAETRRQGGGLVVLSAATGVVWLTHLSYGSGLLYELPRRRDRFVG